jgi:hypothetical protein
MKFLIKTIFCSAVLAIFLTACNKESFTKINVNPQSLNTLNLNFVFTTAQLGAASGGSAGDNRYIDWRTNIGLTAYAIQQLANAGGGIAPGDKYTENLESSAAPWDFIYGDQLKNLALILKESGTGGFGEGQYENMRQAARILRAFLFERLTDYYGSVPYSESMGAEAGVFFPNYDKQKVIYADLLKEVDEASAGLGAANPNDGFAEADLYYHGDVAKWKRWGYSLMLRMAMRISNVDAATAGTYIAKAVAGGVFTSNADNVIVPMAVGPSQWTDQNGISRAFFPGDGGQPTHLSKTLVDWLKGPLTASTADDDPRLMIFTGGIGNWTTSGFQVTDNNPLNQQGMPNGKDASQLPGNPDALYSKINTKLLDLDDPYMLMNYGEVELMLAEAAERAIGGVTGAAVHYAAGVKASMQMYTIYDASLTVSDAAVAAYLLAHPYGVEKPALEMIGNQYWANHYLNWWEAWSNWRRTRFPVLTPVNYPGNITTGKIFERLKYPQSESGSNPNTSTTGTTDDFITKVWWAGGPE